MNQKISSYILPLIIIIIQSFFLCIHSAPEPPEIPQRPSLNDLAKSLGGISEITLVKKNEEAPIGNKNTVQILRIRNFSNGKVDEAK